MKVFLKKFLALGLAGVLTISMAACGGKDTEEGTQGSGSESSNTSTTSEYVYVPEYHSVTKDENGWISNPTLMDGKLYYSVYSYNEETGESKEYYAYRELSSLDTEVEMSVEFSVEGKETSLSNCYVDANGNKYAIWYIYPTYVEGEEYDYNDNTNYLVKYDSTGVQVFAQDLKEVFVDENNAYLQNMAVTNEGKIIASSGNVFYLFNSDGTLDKTIPTDADWIQSMCITDDGKVLYTYYGMQGVEVAEIDAATGAKGASYKNIPDMNGKIKSAGNGKLLIAGYTKLYEYDMATQESVELLTWLDCNVDGSYVQDFEVLEDGRIAVYYDNYNDSSEITILTKTPASEVVQKEIITLATLYDSDSNLQQAAVAFNKSSDKYQIKIKSYIDSNAEWTETTYTDGLALMNADIISKDAPDIIAMTYVNMNSLVSKGAFVDLTPYLEKSTIANKNDFVESVLNAYNYDGVQVTVPASFNIVTLLGKGKYVGMEPGWTLDDVMALAKEYPDASLMSYTTKASALQICLQYNSDSFIDYETGTCNFNSPEFMKVLEFANSFPTEVHYDEDRSFPSMIQSGQVLLADVYLSDVQNYQMYRLMFEEEVTGIGYPTMDGSAGVYLNGSEMYGISASSDCQDGAWAFIESVLARSDNDMYRWNFPSRKDELEEVFTEAMTPHYQYDENGEIMYDEEGNALQYPKTTWGYDDWEAEIYAATQEEVDEIKAMIDMAKPQGGSDQTIFTMISEEAESYFSGQKSAEDVAKIIQSRVELYVSENS